MSDAYNKKGALNIEGAYPSQCIEEITELRTKLAQAEATLKVKDELAQKIIDYESTHEGYIASDYAKDIIAIQPSKEALDEYVMSRLELYGYVSDSTYDLVPHGTICENSNFAFKNPLYRLKDK